MILKACRRQRGVAFNSAEVIKSEMTVDAETDETPPTVSTTKDSQLNCVSADDITLSPPASPRSMRSVQRLRNFINRGESDYNSAQRSVREVPSLVGGTVDSRRVRFGSEHDVMVGSEEAERLAKFRFEQSSDYPDWDQRYFRSIMRFIKSRILMLQKRDDDSRVLASQQEGKQHQFVAQKVLRRPLTNEQRELLRCIGLDSFVTLQFIRLRIDISFWPLLLSAITLVPIFKTGNRHGEGFFSTTVLNLDDGSARHWAVVIFGYIQYAYILRRLWIEWELFLPLRFDFLENGDFQKQKYQQQYRKTCIVEYIPRSHRHDEQLYAFFDAIFPGQVKRAEVLLNTEYFRSLIEERQRHIVAYENVYARKVHRRAEYLRDVQAVDNGNILKRCFGCILRTPQKPEDPKITVNHRIEPENLGNAFITVRTKFVREARTYNALEWHHQNIQRLNKEIDDEYIRLAQLQRRPVQKNVESRISRWLGLKYLIGADTGRLHSSTAFVEFDSVVAKQEVIQCNLTGTNHCMDVHPVPEVRAMIWRNSHVSRALINTRQAWANLSLVGGLVAWSYIVVLIQSVNNVSDWFRIEEPFLESFLDTYIPALVVEGLVRSIPFVIKGICSLIRMKSFSEIDMYILRWYFCFRLFTFLFVIVGGTITDRGKDFIEDPM